MASYTGQKVDHENRPHFICISLQKYLSFMSKKYIFSSMLMLLSLMSYGQHYQSMLIDKRAWLYKCRLQMCNDCSEPFGMVFIYGDTIVNNRRCKKLYSDPGRLFIFYPWELEDFSSIGLFGKYDSAWYEDGKKVYRIMNNSTEAVLMFDFGLAVGDRLPQNESLAYCCDDSIKVGNNTYRRMRFVEADRKGEPILSDWCLVEGIGGNEGILYTEFQIPPENADSYYIEKFQECRQYYNGYGSSNYELLFCSGWFLFDSINSSTDLQHEVSVSNGSASGYFDLQGRRLTEKPSRSGIYIQNGRKYVVK
jgi:hypothetical protein